MIYYIYKITLTKGKLKNHYYIGQHQTDNIDDGYKGSGTYVKKYYKKYPNDYTKEIICYCANADELNEMEAYYVGNLYETDDMCLNLKAGGNQPGISDEARQKMSDAKKGKTFSDEHKQNLSEALKGENNPMYGKAPSDETRKKLSESVKKAMTPEVRQKISEAKKGKTFSDEHKQNLSEAKTGKPSGMKGKKLSTEHIQKMSEALKGTHWYNNGTTQLRAFDCPAGYVAGRLK